MLIELIDERRDVLIDLGPKRPSDHPPRALAREIVKRDSEPFVLPDRERANIHHWRAFLPAITGIGLHQPGRYAAFVLKPIHNIWV